MMCGTVSIVGAGPGDPELLTVKARRRLDTADSVFYDSLVSTAILDSLPDGLQVVNVGKSPGGDRTSQETINRLLVEHVRRGQSVVRLKGGDPFVFGRGGEEIEFLAARNIPFEIVPGITSAVAGPGVRGIPLTHRNHASSVTIITGHEDPTKDHSALDWDAIARTVSAGGTLVILMGVGRLADNVGILREQGVSRETPVAMVERATCPDEFAVTGTLTSIVNKARVTGIAPPAITIVGDVVGVGDSVADCLGTESAALVSPGATESEVNQET